MVKRRPAIHEPEISLPRPKKPSLDHVPIQTNAINISFMANWFEDYIPIYDYVGLPSAPLSPDRPLKFCVHSFSLQCILRRAHVIILT